MKHDRLFLIFKIPVKVGFKIEGILNNLKLENDRVLEFFDFTRLSEALPILYGAYQ